MPDAGAIEEKRKKVKRKKIIKDKYPVVKLVDAVGRNRKQSDQINNDANGNDALHEEINLKRKTKSKKVNKRQKKNTVESNDSLDASNNPEANVSLENLDFLQGIVKVMFPNIHNFKRICIPKL